MVEGLTNGPCVLFDLLDFPESSLTNTDSSRNVQYATFIRLAYILSTFRATCGTTLRILQDLSSAHTVIPRY
ncbi:hypothetical protein RRG08_060042 [Elysia crispata]|uniref:Uncharacterized protein n=1 Tax=Elysia crispata TaxID=231223 RepID=A0AAE1ADS8_9GAST|nr:hypothetical protein RRG08_060042 [Elysia crispata]